MKPPTTTPGTAKDQIQKFREAARAAETDDSEEAFDRALKTVAGHVPRDDREAVPERGKAKQKG